MFELKRLSREGLDAALKKVERYRLLNEPWQAESICQDILELDPGHQEALVALLLSITDQFKQREGGKRVRDARDVLPRLEGEYEKAYYTGIIWERRATALLHRSRPGVGRVAYTRLREAMEWYEKAQELRPKGDDSAIIRWNSCARMIMTKDHIKPPPEDEFQPLLE